jgi:hypothetical protein
MKQNLCLEKRHLNTFGSISPSPFRLVKRKNFNKALLSNGNGNLFLVSRSNPKGEPFVQVVRPGKRCMVISVRSEVAC